MSYHPHCNNIITITSILTLSFFYNKINYELRVEVFTVGAAVDGLRVEGTTVGATVDGLEVGTTVGAVVDGL